MRFPFHIVLFLSIAVLGAPEPVAAQPDDEAEDYPSVKPSQLGREYIYFASGGPYIMMHLTRLGG